MPRPSLPTSNEIPTSPMADIAFLLIIFFMVTLTFAATKGLDFAFDEETEAREIDPVESVLVEVSAGGALAVDGRPLRLEGLLPYLAPKLERDPRKPVIVLGGRSASYGEVVAVLDELRMGRWRLGLERDIDIVIPSEREADLFWGAR